MQTFLKEFNKLEEQESLGKDPIESHEKDFENLLQQFFYRILKENQPKDLKTLINIFQSEYQMLLDHNILLKEKCKRLEKELEIVSKKILRK